MCQKYLNLQMLSFYCDKCLKWIHLDCSELSQHEFVFYSINSKEPFYCKNCVKDFDFNVIESDDFCIICFNIFASLDNCLYCEGCFKCGYIVIVPLNSLKDLMKCVIMIYLIILKIVMWECMYVWNVNCPWKKIVLWNPK